MDILFALRDEKVNIYSMALGNSEYEFGYQFMLCKKEPFKPNRTGAFLLDPKTREANYSLSKEGKKYQDKIKEVEFEYKYIAYVDAQIHVSITDGLFEKLQADKYFTNWEWNAPLKYFQNRKEGYLIIFRVYEIENAISERSLEKGRKGRNFYYRIDGEMNENIIKPVISDVNFEQYKWNFIENLRRNNWLIELIETDVSHLRQTDLAKQLKREIRLLPMSKKYEFPDMLYEEIQESYFLNHLIKEQRGYYYFRNTGITCPEGSLILFQIDGEVIASARLLRTEKFDVPKDGIYKGAIVFDINSICIFEPITAEELSSIDSTFKGFSQVKQKLDYSKINDVLTLIDKKQQSPLPEELGLIESEKYIEGAKQQITINAYERNDKARKECIKLQGSTCKICGFDFGEVYGQEFEGKIHIHHIKPLNEIDDTYEVNPATDLIPVCPNCHMILHSKVGGVYSVEEVKKMIGRRNKK